MSELISENGWMVWDHDNERWIPSTFFHHFKQAQAWVDSVRMTSKGRSIHYEAFPVTIAPRPDAATLRKADL